MLTEPTTHVQVGQVLFLELPDQGLQSNQLFVLRAPTFFDRAGNVLGEHEGYHRYTIGQRKRIRVTDETPYYVLGIDKDKNLVFVGKKEELKSFRMTIEDVNWMRHPHSQDYQVKIRSRHQKSPARLITYSKDEALIEFYEGESAVSPGQAAVLYDGDAVVGGGWIEKTY